MLLFRQFLPADAERNRSIGGILTYNKNSTSVRMKKALKTKPANIDPTKKTWGKLYTPWNYSNYDEKS